MKRLIGFTFTAIVLYADFTFSKQTVPQIKCLGTQSNYSNTENNKGIAMYLTRENETYNNVNLYWDLAKDLSSDLTLDTKVYATDDTFQGGELILKISTPICQPNENRELLPKLFVVDKSLLGQSCIKAGKIKIKDMGQFRFEVKVPNIQSKGKYFRADYVVREANSVNYIVSFYNELHK